MSLGTDQKMQSEWTSQTEELSAAAQQSGASTGSAVLGLADTLSKHPIPMAHVQ